jgi:hypothetical protein
MVHWLMSCAPCDVVSLWLIVESHGEPCDIVLVINCGITWAPCDVVSLWLIVESYGEPCDFVSLWLIVESYGEPCDIVPCD